MKKDLLRVYAIIFGAFMFLSSVYVMFKLISGISFIPERFDSILIMAIIALHIGSCLLMLSGRLKD